MCVREIQALPSGNEDYEITDWIIIAVDGKVTLGLSQPEVGQGSYTALPQILAEELDADWQHVEVRFVTGKQAYKIAFRQEVPVAERRRLDVDNGALRAASRFGRRRSRGAHAGCSAEVGPPRFGVPDRDRRRHQPTRRDVVLRRSSRRLPPSFRSIAAPPLKDERRFHVIGKPVPRLDTPAKCNGSAVYGIDVVVPAMLNGAIRTAPSFTGQVVAIKNEADILKMAGVHAVVKIPALSIANEDDGSQHPPLAHAPRYNAVCVVADRFWQAKRAIDSLDVVFDGGPHGDLSTAKIETMLDTALTPTKGVTVIEQGTAARDPAGSRGLGHRTAFRAAAHRARAP